MRVSELMMTLSPMTMRSNGFNSTLNGIVVSSSGYGAGIGLQVVASRASARGERTAVQ